MKTALPLAILLVLPTAVDASDYAWLEYGPDGPIARAIVKGKADCPSIVIDGKSTVMSLRVTTSNSFNVTTCEQKVALGTKSAAIDGKPLPVGKLGKATKIAIIGDTGCDTAGGQNCDNDWPFATNAQSIAKWDPDLVIQVGDYYYREEKDSEGNPAYDWTGWEADFFQPADPLLRNAPWIFVRGNHEACGRAAAGWFRFLDPRAYKWCGPKNCASAKLDFTPPYVITIGSQTFAIMDSSAAAAGANANEDQAKAYGDQLTQIDGLVPKGSSAWLLLHHPFWLLQEDGTGIMTMYKAWDQATPKNLSLVVSGHKHLLETLDFSTGGVPQLVVGNGGTAVVGKPSLGRGTSINGRVVRNVFVRNDWGFMAATRTANGWSMQVMTETGALRATCTVTSSSFVCTKSPSGSSK